MQEYLFPIEAFVLINAKTSQDKIFHELTDLYLWRESHSAFYNLLQVSHRVFLAWYVPRKPANQHHITHDPQRPDIALIGIVLTV